ncbi:cyclase family protein [Streptomyces fuscichromogenes]|uniref:Cyclase n=1 Tax=Streptomyces fuscichromogenes TaxID=1324013 RepID=A0A917XGF5_9ACTN|nr:cyclase family protein [Streptomyces fuscichromogenes]GGN23285.1 hypothetical protein GCM10011578_055450 [Streptomyces fuscichromogenes]
MSDSTTLPHHPLGKELSNWGRWGDDDEIGTLNFITPAKRVASARLVRTGKTFDLGMAFGKEGPATAGSFRENPQHVMTLPPSDTAGFPDGPISSDDMVVMSLQAATQWDGLGHMGYDGHFYNNVPAAAINNFAGVSRNSFDKAAGRLISRGVLLDIAALKGVDRLDESYEITVADLLAAEERQGVRVESGDILCIRTGWHQWFAEGDRDHYMSEVEPGPGMDTLPWLHEREVAALALDNWAVEVSPSPVDGAYAPFHQIAIRDMGLTLGEMWDFEALAADCAQDGVWEFLLCASGLKVTASAGSPITPIALKQQPGSRYGSRPNTWSTPPLPHAARRPTGYRSACGIRPYDGPWTTYGPSQARTGTAESRRAFRPTLHRPTGQKTDQTGNLTVSHTSPRPTGRSSTPNPKLIVPVLALAGVVVAVMQTLVLPIVPRLPRLLDTSSSDASWAVTATLLTSAVATPVAGQLGDMYGKRRLARRFMDPRHGMANDSFPLFTDAQYTAVQRRRGDLVSVGLGYPPGGGGRTP